MSTVISWADESWNYATGCTKLLTDCDHCYAEEISLKRGWSQYPWDKAHERENIVLHPDGLDMPRHWKRPRVVFVNSMSDAFHPRIPDDFAFRALDIMCEVDRHLYLILTKRPQRVKGVVGAYCTSRRPARLPEHIWIGTSLGMQAGLFRLDQLREASGLVPHLWVSIEPLLEDLGPVNLDGIEWVVLGGESGKGYRPMDHAWVRAIRDQCRRQIVPFYYQHGGGQSPESNPLNCCLFESDGAFNLVREVPRRA